MNRPIARTRGFTLLEVLVAIAVFAIFSVIAYGSLLRLIESRERIDAERTFWRDLSLGFLRMQTDFGQARARGVRDNAGNPQPLPAFRGQPTDIRALGEPSVELTRGGVAAFAAHGADLQRIGYRLSEKQLLRLTWPVLDRAPTTQPSASPLLDDVEELQMRFYYNGAWLDRWPPEPVTPTTPPLPGAVEVSLTLAGRGKFVRTFLVGSGT